MKSTNIPYLPRVDHLRALAAVWIVLYHGTQIIGARLRGHPGPHPGLWEYTSNPLAALVLEGHTAVALFMVLTGFIFTHGALGKRVRYGPFVLNRVLRIYPLYVAVGLWVLSARTAAGGSSSVESLLTTLLPLSTFRWTDTAEIVPMSWAVAVEFQFYLLFPFLLARFNDRPLRVAGAVIGTALLFRILAVLNGAGTRDLVYMTLVGRIDQFVLGMVAALAYARLGRPSAVPALVLAGPLAVAALFGYHRLGGWPDFGWWKVLWPPVEGAVWALLVFGYVGTGRGGAGGVSRVVAKVGEVSFSIYLLHMLVVVPAGELAVRYQLTLIDPWIDAFGLTVGIVLPVVLVLSLLTYRVVERPFLALRRKYLVEPGEAPRGV